MRLMGFTVVAKPVGLAYQMILAKMFGAGIQYDAFVFAAFLASLLEVVISGVYQSVVMPMGITLKRQLDRRELMGFQNAAILLFMLPAFVYLVVLVVRSSWVIDLLGANLPPETRGYVDKMVDVMALPALALILVAILKWVLNQNQLYRLPASLPPVHSIVLLATVVAFGKRLGIWSLPLGYAISSLGQVIVLAVHATTKRCLDFTPPRLPPGTRAVLWAQSQPMIVSQVMLMFTTSINRFFAAGLEAGSIAAVTYSMTIINLWTQLFNLSLVVVMFTKMSELIAQADYRKCGDYLFENSRRLSNIVGPVSFGLFVASAEIVRVLFQRGEFNAGDTSRTAGVLGLYMLGMPAYILNLPIAKTFHSLQRYKEKVWLDGQYLAFNIVGNYFLCRLMGVDGLALSTSIAMLTHVLLSLWRLHTYQLGLHVGRVSRLLVATYVTGAAAWAVIALSGVTRRLDASAWTGTTAGAMASGAIKFSLAAGMFFAFNRLLRRLERRRRARLPDGTRR